jgi:AcrR family transcriptional regulator
MRKPAAKTRNAKTRNDWIDAALVQLRKTGVDAVRVDPLSTQLRVTRGSFYWHFRDRKDLLLAMLETWRLRQTTRIVERIRKDQALSPQERVVRLRSLPPKTPRSLEAAELELAVRAWANRDRLARKAVDAVDRERLEFVAALLHEAGLSAHDAREWAFIGYAYALGEPLLRAIESEGNLLSFRRRLLELQLPGARLSQGRRGS